MRERLQKIIAAAGVASRRRSEELIVTGRVSVDGRVVTELGAKADPDTQTITVDGVPVQVPERKFYILLNKPRGYTSSRSDRHAARLVTELVKDVTAALHPVGRLDVDTEGLLLFTNDGKFTYALTHPKHLVPKTYVATVTGQVTPPEIRRLQKGVELDDGMTAPARARLLGIERNGRTSVVELTITEGRKRQVRRMFAALGHRVGRLVRTKIGDVELGDLAPGAWRHLSEREVERLMRNVEGRT